MKCEESKTPFRIWSLGCAGGEEAYSLAILLREYFARDLRHVTTTIDATDIDEGILQAARKAEFNEDRLKELPNEIRERYFHSSGSRVRLTDTIREMVNFYQDDITAVENFLPCNLVFRTLIYFSRRIGRKYCMVSHHHRLADSCSPAGTLVGDVRRRFSGLCP
jgi:chemotaxis protein methyltransferase CheR